MSINWQIDVEPRPAILVLPPAAASLDEAHAAIELWEFYSRKRLDPTQRLVVEVLMAEDAHGKWAAATTGREMPRQNGKGDEIEVVELWGLVQRSEAIMHTVHDAVLLATQTQDRMLRIIEGHADLRRRKKRAWRGTGQQMIEMRNGGIIWYRTRTGGGGRGVDDVDRLVVDEAQHATEEHLSALSPTLFANDNPQLNALGTAGLDGKSEWWWTMRLRALSPDPGAYGYVGHTAEQVSLDPEGRVAQEPVDPEDRGLWLASNPALHAGRGQGMSYFEEELRRLGPDSFAREHLCVWDPPLTNASTVINATDWRAALDTNHKPTGPLAYALDVSPNGSSCAVAVSDGDHVEVVKHGDGTAWIVAACESHRDAFSEIVVDPTGPAVEVVAALEVAGIPVRKVSTEDARAAAAQFLTALTDRTVHHIGQPELDAAAANADRREVGDGGWLWSRRKSTVDISPLVAVTLARWAALATKPTPEPGFLSLADFLDEE